MLKSNLLQREAFNPCDVVKVAPLTFSSLPPHRCHISSACEDDQVYVHAISDARCVFDMGVSNVKYGQC